MVMHYLIVVENSETCIPELQWSPEVFVVKERIPGKGGVAR